jgi:hypothetical protein
MAAERRTIRDGLAVGLIGYAAVALFYTVFDLLAARDALHTVNVLGRAVFRGLRDPSVLQFSVELDRGAIFAYNALHLTLALAIGFIVAALVALAEQNESYRGLVRFMTAAGYAVTVAMVGLLTAPMRDLLPWWSILLANALAAVLAGVYLFAKHPGLLRRMALIEA